MVSIVIVSHQADEKYLKESLCSCVLQNNCEVVLVFAGSHISPQTERALGVTNAKFIQLTGDPGHAQCRNIGVDAASYDNILFLDADNWLYPDAVARLYEHKSETLANVVCGNMTCDHVNVIEPHMKSGVDELLLRCTNPVFVSSLFDRAMFRKIGGLDPSIVYDDYNMWVRMYMAGAKFSYINQTIFWHRIRPDSITHIMEPYNESLMKEATKPLYTDQHG